MRICPRCGDKRKSETETVTMHLDDKCYADIVEENGGLNLAARDAIGAIYGAYGLQHAGELPNKLKEEKPRKRK